MNNHSKRELPWDLFGRIRGYTDIERITVDKSFLETEEAYICASKQEQPKRAFGAWWSLLKYFMTVIVLPAPNQLTGTGLPTCSPPVLSAGSTRIDGLSCTERSHGAKGAKGAKGANSLQRSAPGRRLLAIVPVRTRA